MILGVIPARMASVRFPGKPLADIGGKPMVWHVWQQARRSRRLTRVMVATCDQEIFATCEGLGIEVHMTAGHHQTGTDRVAEIAERVRAETYVNIQGDEPMVDPRAIDRLLEGTDVNLIANAMSRIGDPHRVLSANVVKVVCGVDGEALMFSRSPIPYPRNREQPFMRQLGLYAFTQRALAIFASMKPGPLELAEGVEMLRFVEHGLAVHMVEVPDDRSVAVDTPADLQRVRELMAA